VEIMQQLRTLQRCVCGDLVARLPLAQSTVSQHLKVLRQAGLIRCEAAGPSTRYCVDQQNVDALKALIAAL
jgi:ArsR family transcriptional regulator